MPPEEPQDPFFSGPDFDGSEPEPEIEPMDQLEEHKTNCGVETLPPSVYAWRADGSSLGIFAPYPHNADDNETVLQRMLDVVKAWRPHTCEIHFDGIRYLEPAEGIAWSLAEIAHDSQITVLVPSPELVILTAGCGISTGVRSRYYIDDEGNVSFGCVTDWVDAQTTMNQYPDITTALLDAVADPGYPDEDRVDRRFDIIRMDNFSVEVVDRSEELIRVRVFSDRVAESYLSADISDHDLEIEKHYLWNDSDRRED